MGPVSGQCGWDGGLRWALLAEGQSAERLPERKAGRASFLAAISGHKPVGTRQTSDQPDRDQHRPRDRSLFPREALLQSVATNP
jgi:hypothetical protein